MKYIGFVREITNIEESVTLSELPNASVDYDEETLKQIKNYLDSGVCIFGWMGYSEDPLTKQPIAPDGFFTDGKWVWPNYLYYYIEKYSMEVNPDFILDMQSAKFKFNPSNTLRSSLGKLELELAAKIK